MSSMYTHNTSTYKKINYEYFHSKFDCCSFVLCCAAYKQFSGFDTVTVLQYPFLLKFSLLSTVLYILYAAFRFILTGPSLTYTLAGGLPASRISIVGLSLT